MENCNSLGCDSPFLKVIRNWLDANPTFTTRKGWGGTLTVRDKASGVEMADISLLGDDVLVSGAWSWSSFHNQIKVCLADPDIIVKLTAAVNRQWNSHKAREAAAPPKAATGRGYEHCWGMLKRKR